MLLALHDADRHYLRFHSKPPLGRLSVHLQCPFKKINKWLKTDFSARGKNYYLTISLMKTEVKYQPALDKQHAEPSITLSRAEPSALTTATWLLRLRRQARQHQRVGTFPRKFCPYKDPDRNSLSCSFFSGANSLFSQTAGSWSAFAPHSLLNCGCHPEACFFRMIRSAFPKATTSGLPNS